MEAMLAFRVQVLLLLFVCCFFFCVVHLTFVLLLCSAQHRDVEERQVVPRNRGFEYNRMGRVSCEYLAQTLIRVRGFPLREVCRHSGHISGHFQTAKKSEHEPQISTEGYFPQVLAVVACAFSTEGHLNLLVFLVWKKREIVHFPFAAGAIWGDKRRRWS